MTRQETLDKINKILRAAFESIPSADLFGADLRSADLSSANLSSAKLYGADLPAIPAIDNIDAKILEATENGKFLNMRNWHCGTTHCRAGWAVTLAGDEGRALEAKIGANAAGALIYTVSRPGQRVPAFFASNEDTLADLRACARK